MRVSLQSAADTITFGFSLAYCSYRVSTNLTGQISRRFPGDSRRDFEKIPGDICIASACYVTYRIYFCDVVWLNIEQKTRYAFYKT